MNNVRMEKTPKLICIATKDLLCKVKANASSLPTCEAGKAYADKYACPELTVGETWGDGGEMGMCGVLSQCIEVGPLFGCYYEVYCSSAYILR